MLFDVDAHDPGSSRARWPPAHPPMGEVPTPIFMPVGTLGTVKGVHPHELKTDIRAHIVLGNTYHLYLRPGTDILEKAGGLHAFTTWDGPMLTDSGGFQVHSLQDIRKITEEGSNFNHTSMVAAISSLRNRSWTFNAKSERTSSWPSTNARITPCAKPYAREAMERTHRWLDRCIARWDATSPLYGFDQALFPIVQGSTYSDLRRESAEYIASKNAWGNAIGGLSVGEPAEEMYAMAEEVCQILPADKPRYLMGVGTPANILENIALGVDMFDCVMPTRNARNGQIFTSEGIINLRNAKWRDDFSPLDPQGDASVDQRYTKAYMRHLFMADEALGKQIASIHNLRFYLWLVEEARKHIVAGDFAAWKNTLVPRLQNRL